MKEKRMRSAIAVVSAVAMTAAQMPAGLAQNAVSRPAQLVSYNPAQAVFISPAIVKAFDAFPKGGDLLRKRIAETIEKEPKLAVELVKYLQTTSALSKDQKLAAERGLADALNRLGIRAADLPVRTLPPPPSPVQANPEAFDAFWLLPFALLAGGICLVACRSEGQPGPISPN
jgi:hypothetical protein